MYRLLLPNFFIKKWGWLPIAFTFMAIFTTNAFALNGYSLFEIIQKIEEKHHVEFAYSNEVRDMENIDISLDGSLDNVIQQLSKKTGLSFKRVDDMFIVQPPKEQPKQDQQERIIKGQVKDALSGEPIIGATVIIKGSTAGTITDMDGNYELKASMGNILVFAFLGFEPQEVVFTSQSIINVELNENAQELTEVVVTALGLEKEAKAVGYSTQEVKSDAIETVRQPNVMTNLTGKVAGLDVKNSTEMFDGLSIEIRGREPLIVVDGIPVETNLYDINPDDIESVNVLKGASASALYGSRGKDGAVMISMKKGKGKSDKLDINVNMGTQMQTGFVVLPETQSQYGMGSNGQYWYVDGKGGGIADGDGWVWGPKLNQRDPNTASGYREIAQWNSPIDPVTGERIATPWVSKGENNLQNFLSQASISNLNLSVAKHTENGYVRVSAGHMYQSGMVPNTDLNISNVSVTTQQKLGKKFTLDAFFSYNKQYSDNYPRTGYGPHNYMYNLLFWMGPDVDVRDLRNYWADGQEGYQQRNYNDAWYNNPYFVAYENRQMYDKNTNLAYATLTYDINDNLKILNRASINNSSEFKDLKTPKSFLDYSNDIRGNYEIWNADRFWFNNDLIITYNKKFNDNWALSMNLGGNYNSYQARDMYSGTDGLQVPNNYNLANSIGPVTATNMFYNKAMYSVYGTAELAWKNAIFLNLAARNDWSSTLPASNNSYFYPSVSTSVVVSDLIEMPEAVSIFKLRGSMAQVSGDLDIYQTQSVYRSANRMWNGNAQVYYPSTLLNPNIRPETSTTFELGTDVRFLRDRIGFDLTYYEIVDTDQIIKLPTSEASGFDERYVNGNEYKQQGIELMVHATPIRKNNFEWNTSMNWSKFVRKLTSIYGGQDNYNGLQAGDRTDTYLGYDWERSPEGEIVYDANSGLPIVNPTRTAMGHTAPDWLFGFQNSFRYKNWSLGFAIDGRIGGIMYSTTNQKMMWGGVHMNTLSEHRDRDIAGESSFVGQGVIVTGGEIVRDAQGNVISDTRTFAPNSTGVGYSSWVIDHHGGRSDAPGLFDASYVKLREVSITYNVPKTFASKLHMKGASVSLTCNNVWMWSNIPNVDPDIGYDNSQSPSPRYTGINLKANF
ncbi:SusC/RagA family TonB-linked outer membrane protein [Flammeovirga sp. MY04]|uniref:SusC/RagA family TonB-linked outer membrane protein n=1 Tax=Flammeovirga sp. MY04 TaxID=1191459 RepID=UPI00080638EF|nr:SusC/RagA family TonB-linked outer membrane protein [Flammeovirga sp. MY04]ANQ50609.1 SusC/RagA family TonB-linked outer membrane protein [Flammeovirga sp. MY04]